MTLHTKFSTVVTAYVHVFMAYLKFIKREFFWDSEKPTITIDSPSEKRQLISDHTKGPLVAAFRSPLMKAQDRSVETLGLWIVTSSVTFSKSVNQSSIKPCLIVHLVALWTFIYYMRDLSKFPIIIPAGNLNARKDWRKDKFSQGRVILVGFVRCK